uniref:Ig-like domain-containing protein n=1 Tax=Periophthalmus magnuspinnatus TaxID=409849 RepID=A0A3B4BJ93_9GOBI
MTDIAILCWTLLWTGPTAGEERIYKWLTAPPAELGVTQSPGRLTVLRGETATLCCHFTVPSQWRGFQWFRMNPDRQSILPSARYVFLEKNQSSSLLITEAAPKDSGEYYCEVSVPYQDPEWGNGTLLTVLGESREYTEASFSSVTKFLLIFWVITASQAKALCSFEVHKSSPRSIYVSAKVFCFFLRFSLSLLLYNYTITLFEKC